MQTNSIFKAFGGQSYDAILDRFTSLDDVKDAIRKAGLESCNLIFGKDLLLIHILEVGHPGI